MGTFLEGGSESRSGRNRRKFNFARTAHTKNHQYTALLDLESNQADGRRLNAALIGCGVYISGMLSHPHAHGTFTAPSPSLPNLLPSHRLVPPALKPSEIQDNGRNHEYVYPYRVGLSQRLANARSQERRLTVEAERHQVAERRIQELQAEADRRIR